MKRAKNYFLVVAALATATLTVVLTDAGQVAAQAVKTQFVKVINTTDEPVPTLAQGTTNVAGTVGITGTPTVNAQQSGSWTVGITGTPTVGLAGGSSILVDNNAANPVPVRDVDNPARQPFQASGSTVVNAGFDDSCRFGLLTLTTVPAMKQLVIEDVSFWGGLPAGQRFLQVTVNNTAGGTPMRHYLPVALQATDISGTFDAFAASQPVRWYADPETDVFACFVRNATAGTGSAHWTISGYLVDVP